MQREVLLSVTEAAPLLGMAPYTLRRWLRGGAIPGVKIGVVWKIRESTITAIQCGELKITRKGDDHARW